MSSWMGWKEKNTAIWKTWPKIIEMGFNRKITQSIRRKVWNEHKPSSMTILENLFNLIQIYTNPALAIETSVWRAAWASNSAVLADSPDRPIGFFTHQTTCDWYKISHHWLCCLVEKCLHLLFWFTAFVCVSVHWNVKVKTLKLQNYNIIRGLHWG